MSTVMLMSSNGGCDGFHLPQLAQGQIIQGMQKKWWAYLVVRVAFVYGFDPQLHALIPLICPMLKEIYI